MIFSRRHSIAAIALSLAACASPNPSRVAVSMMGVDARGDSTTYAARSTDTIYKIAQNLGVSAGDMIKLNNLQAPYNVTPGQRLRIPAPEFATTQEGDTLYSIARTYDADQGELIRLNHLQQPYRFARGTKLKLPSELRLEESPAANALATTSPNGTMLASDGRPLIDNGTTQTAATNSTGPIYTTENGNGSKTHKSAGGVIMEQDLAPPPGATQQAANTPAKLASLTPPATVPATSGAAKPAVQQKLSLGTGVPKFSWPVNGSKLSEYGPKAGGRHNDGMNLGAPLGTPVRAAAPGEVVYTGDNVAGFGNLILIRHSGGFATAYAHLQSPLVKKGEMVSAGQSIAQIGKTGNVSSPQLHFEIRKGTKPVDPKTYLP